MLGMLLYTVCDMGTRRMIHAPAVAIVCLSRVKLYKGYEPASVGWNWLLRKCHN